MTIRHDSVDLPAPWRAAAAYFYTLDLDGPALAWEYLRRNAGYQADWLNHKRRTVVAHWGLQSRRKPAPRCSFSSPALVRSG